ncbi:unnamed protein product, partial [Symbiodinium necroappetens]
VALFADDVPAVPHLCLYYRCTLVVMFVETLLLHYFRDYLRTLLVVPLKTPLLNYPLLMLVLASDSFLTLVAPTLLELVTVLGRPRELLG